jgi:hypothetical protein
MGRVPYRLRPWFSPARNLHVESRLGEGPTRPPLGCSSNTWPSHLQAAAVIFFLTALISKRGCRQKESEMRVFVASLIVLLVLYFWDRDYNNGNLVDGLDSMRRAISHSMSH